jgi:hypothetical protein
MPLPLDDNSVSDSSDDTTLDVATNDQQLGNEQQVDTGADGADSSDAHGDNAAQDTAGLVRDVVKQGREQATASPAEGVEQQTQEAADQEDKGESDDYADAPFNKHPRFRHLIKVRDGLKAERDSFKEDAGRYHNVQTFMDDHGISSQETADAFMFMADVKAGRFAEAWDKIKPTVQELLVRAGEVLPDDLKQDVDAGAISQERAVELSRQRAKAASLEQGRSFDQQRQQRSSQQAAAQQLHSTAIDWSRDRGRKDPQFQAKMPLLMKEVSWLQSQRRGTEGHDHDGRPLTSEGVKAQLEEAYKNVVPPAARGANGKFVPKVGDGTAKPRPTAAGGASGTARPQPKTTLDIIRAVREQRAG